MNYVYTICGAEFDSIAGVRRAYRSLSDKGRETVILAALDWASPCNEALAMCLADDEDGPCGLRWVETVLNRMAIWMEFRGIRKVGDNTLGVHIPFDYDQEQEQD